MVEEGRASEKHLREELGRQGEVIRELVAEVGRLKEQQGIMAMQVSAGNPSPHLHAHPSSLLRTVYPL